MGDGGFWHNGPDQRHRQRGVQQEQRCHADRGQPLLGGRPVGRISCRRARATGPAPPSTRSWRAVRGGGGALGCGRSTGRMTSGAMRDTLKAALTSREPGPKVIVASSECMLNRQRRERPLMLKAIKAGERVVRPKFGVDEDVCTGGPRLHPLVRLPVAVGCATPGTRCATTPVAVIDQSCVGCGNCGEVAEAAVLCPSFYRADIVSNPTAWDQRLARLRGRRDRLAAAAATTAPASRSPEHGPDVAGPVARARSGGADLPGGAGDGRPGWWRAGGLDRGAGWKGVDGWRSPPRGARAWHSARGPRSITWR